MGGRVRRRPSRQQLILDLKELRRTQLVADKYGVCLFTVCRWKKQYGLPTDNIGSRHWSSKLTDHEVRLVRQLAVDGVQQKEIAEKMELAQSTVSHIVNYISYRNVP